MAVAPALMQLVDAFNYTLFHAASVLETIPLSDIVVRYVKNSYSGDPFRIILELFLIFFTARYLLAKKYRIKNNPVQLTEKEIDELVQDWKPTPLVPEMDAFDQDWLDKTPVFQRSFPCFRVYIHTI